MAPTLQKRMDELKAARFESLGIERTHAAARHAMFERAHQFFGAPTVVVPLHGPHTHGVVDI